MKTNNRNANGVKDSLNIIMKLQCNVCHDNPTVTIDTEPNHSNDLICCPSCDKQLAYTTEKKYSSKLIWKPLDTDFNDDYGKIPVKIISL